MFELDEYDVESGTVYIETRAVDSIPPMTTTERVQQANEGVDEEEQIRQFEIGGSKGFFEGSVGKRTRHDSRLDDRVEELPEDAFPLIGEVVDIDENDDRFGPTPAVVTYDAYRRDTGERVGEYRIPRGLIPNGITTGLFELRAASSGNGIRSVSHTGLFLLEPPVPIETRAGAVEVNEATAGDGIELDLIDENGATISLSYNRVDGGITEVPTEGQVFRVIEDEDDAETAVAFTYDPLASPT